MKRAGHFIAVEGGDGAGKGGVISALSKALAGLGLEYIVTREPGGTPEGEQLRSLLVETNGPSWDPKAELLLMTAARLQHVERVILPALERGAIVICDRFVASTLAYQGAGRGLPASLILSLHRDFIDDLWPHLTIVLDVEGRIGLERSRSRLVLAGHDEGRFEELDQSFHEKVRQSFLEQADDHPDRHIVIDAHQQPEEVQAQAVSELRRYLKKNLLPDS